MSLRGLVAVLYIYESECDRDHPVQQCGFNLKGLSSVWRRCLDVSDSDMHVEAALINIVLYTNWAMCDENKVTCGDKST